MKFKLAIAVLALSSFAFAQRGGHGGGGAMGGGAMGGGAGMSGSHGMSSGMGQGMGSSRGQGQMGQGGQMGQQNRGQRTPTDLLNQNTKLSSNLQKLLPQGMTPQQACSGFKNLGQCVAAIHVSNNLGIPFADLQSKMTGSGSESLGKAIKDLKPTANAKAETKKAQKQAKQDLKTNS